MQQDKRYFAVVAGSLEKHARAELEELKAEVSLEVPRGLYFSCDQETLYRVLYTSRLLQRVLMPLLNFPCHSIKYLYQQAYKNLDWTSLFTLEQSFGIDTNVSNSFTRHSLFAGQVLKDAICDSFRAKYNQRPNYSNKEPDLLFNLHIHNNHVSISQDLLGKSMHQRGYRQSGHEAPLQETLAAAIIRLTGWNGETPLIDPMCGSGTLLAEALMHYCRIPAGYLRDNSRLGYSQGFDPILWAQTVTSSNAMIRELPKGLIQGSDISGQALEITRMNLSPLPGSGRIVLKHSRFQDLPSLEGVTIVCNPPYGVRLESPERIKGLYNELGDFLKQKCQHSTAYVLCGDKDLVKELRLRAHWAKSLKNGDLDTRLAKILMR
ncbi:MAG TPA: class I SAM-dependent RNA methyltransferase [Candidatus Cloacimonadota bacterium]|nr:class I SAM-dependent RNA methyltransferase [Candidatus Cloacimonadota bacterium]